jgi:hypothetical protein
MVVVICALLLFSACKNSEPVKRLNSQNEQAGAMVEKDPLAAPETRRAGKDVKLNSQSMAKEIGQPAEPVEYTPENSARDRKQVPDKSWYVRIFDDIWTILSGVIIGGGAANLVGRFVPALAGPWGSIATTLISAIAKGRAKAETKKEASDAIKAILTQLESELVDAGLQGKVKDLAKAIEADEEIGHTVTLR